MRRLTILALVLVALTVIASVGQAQPYKFSVAPEVAPWGHVVKIIFENRLNSTIYLPPRPMWSIYDSANRLVYLAPGSSIHTPVRPYETVTWPWMQRDRDGRQVPSGAYEARCYYTTGPGSPYLTAPFIIQDSVVVVTGEPRPGKTIALDLYSKKSAGLSYRLGLAFGKSPGIPLTKQHTLPLNYDPLFVLSQNVGAPIFLNFAGWLDRDGEAQAAIQIPAQPALRGYQFYTAFAIFDPAAPDGIRGCSAATKIRIL